MSLSHDLTILNAHGLIDLVQSEPEPIYTFRNALVQDAAYDSLLRQDRTRLHRAVAEAQCAQYPEHQDELAALIAQHYALSGAAPEAVAYFTRAGDHALSTYANREAERFYRQGLEQLTSAIPPPPDGERLEARLLAGLSAALFRQGAYADAFDACVTGINLYRALGDGNRLGELYARACRSLWRYGDMAGNQRLCREGLAAVAGFPDSEGITMLLRTVARAYHLQGRSAEGYPLARQALAMAERLGLVPEQASALATLGGLATVSPAERLAMLTRAAELAETHNLLVTAYHTHTNLGELFITHVGDLRLARAHFLRARSLARRRGVAAEELLPLTMAALVALLQGDLPTATNLRPQSKPLVESAGPRSPATLRLALVDALLARYRGEHASARVQLEACRVRAAQQNSLQELDMVDNFLAELLIELGEYSAAETVATEAVTLGDHGLLWGPVWPRTLLCTAQACAGHLEQAYLTLASARACVNTPSTLREEEQLALAEGTLAARTAQWDAAIHAYTRAAEYQRKLGLRWYRARTHLVLAHAYAAHDDAPQASALRQEASTAFAELGASSYLARSIPHRSVPRSTGDIGDAH